MEHNELPMIEIRGEGYQFPNGCSWLEKKQNKTREMVISLQMGKPEALRGHLACARSYGHTKNSLSCVRCTPMREPVRKGIKTHPQISGIYEEL